MKYVFMVEASNQDDLLSLVRGIVVSTEVELLDFSEATENVEETPALMNAAVAATLRRIAFNTGDINLELHELNENIKSLVRSPYVREEVSQGESTYSGV